MLSLTIGEAREESMPVFDPEQRRRLHRYSSDHRMWFQDWLLNPVSKALLGILPSRLSNLYAEIQEFEYLLGGNLGEAITVEERHLPLLKRVLLYQKLHQAEKQEELRYKSANQEIRKEIDALTESVDQMMAQEWVINVRELSMPSITEFLTLQAAYEVLPVAIGSISSKYDEKFRILQSQADFLPRLHECRIESWLRGIDISVAFIDIDDFKTFNTKYTESIVDGGLLPQLMQTLESHVYAHGWAYRFGGDEYILLLPNISSDSILPFLRSLHEKLRSLAVAGIDEPITVSIGLCTIAADAILTDAEVQRKANKAKEFAKKSGKNCIAMSKSPFFLEKDLHIA